jgi:hypothetical protein
MSELEFPTSLGTSSADEIRLLGQNLTEDLMGKVGFGELAFWLVTLRRPTPSEVRVFEAVLVALADHGFTPTAIASRLTYLSAPDSLQGALAAGLLEEGRASSGSPRTAASSSTASSKGKRTCPPTTPAGTRSPSTPYAVSASPAGTSRASGTRSTKCSTRARPR